MHKSCLLKYYKTDWRCPICRKSMIDNSLVEAHYDAQFAATIMPEEYRDAKINIFCHDCSKTSVAPFHVLGAKCKECRSYNTVRDKGEMFYEKSTEES